MIWRGVCHSLAEFLRVTLKKSQEEALLIQKPAGELRKCLKNKFYEKWSN